MMQMAHDPRSQPKFLVPETGHQKLVSKLRIPDTRNWYQKHDIPILSVHFDGQNAAGPALKWDSSHGDQSPLINVNQQFTLCSIEMLSEEMKWNIDASASNYR